MATHEQKTATIKMLSQIALDKDAEIARLRTALEELLFTFEADINWTPKRESNETSIRRARAVLAEKGTP